jgi:ATP-dependent DNA helicase RecG
MQRPEYVRYLLDRGAGVTEWERLPAVHHGIDDLDHQEILRTVRLGIEAGRLPEDTGTSIPDILDRFRLRRDGRLVNAAAVLFSKAGFLDYPQCTIRLALFAGTTKDEFIANRQEQGHAFALLEEAMTFFRRHLSIAGRFHPDSIVREDIPEYPVFALREAVVNALIHRSYVDAGGAVSIAIFSDRLEIWSQGILPFGQRPEELTRPHTSQPRNPIIANVFFRRGLIEAWGRGTQKIVELCVAAGHPEPEFTVAAGAVVVTFRPRASVVVPRPRFDLTERQRALLDALASGEAKPLREIRARLVDPPTDRMLQQDLSRLRELGLVVAAGRGRGATYRMAKE